MKTIIWCGALHVLGPTTLIALETNCIRIENSIGVQRFFFKDHGLLQKRIETDEPFKNMLEALALNILIRFFHSPDMHILDLAGSLLSTEIEAKKPDNGQVVLDAKG